jgi:large subunit ribosomal protein L10
MDRAEKEALVASLHRTFAETAVVVVTHYSGLTVAEMSDLRARLREAGAALKVAKNRLVRLALPGTPYQGLEPLFKGPTAIAYSADPVAAAKTATAFAKTNAKLIILGGGLGQQMLDGEGIRALATLPSLDELRGRLIGLLNAPATRLAQVLQAPAGQLARVLSARAEKDEAAAA